MIRMAKPNRVEEDAYWRCPICGQGGRCAKGDEATAQAVHIAMMHPKGK